MEDVEFKRVTASIGEVVHNFWLVRLGAVSPNFYAQDLVSYVTSNIKETVAPSSPTRILQALRKKGVINYEVISRRDSLYKALPVANAAVPQGE